MENIFIKIIVFSLIPASSVIIGFAIAAFYPPTSKVRSIILHFAAGIVFSVVAVELLPDIIEKTSVMQLGIGFSAGVILMLGLKQFMHVSEKKAEKNDSSQSENSYPSTLIIGVGVDILIDGILIGIGFAAGQTEGILLTSALAIEIFVLGLAVSAEMSQRKISKKLRTITVLLLAFVIIIGAAIGAIMLSVLSIEILHIVLSFALAALLYLVTEELLVESHNEPDSPLISSTFFLGFLLFLIIGMLT